jgi:hypothetical protein
MREYESFSRYESRNFAFFIINDYLSHAQLKKIKKIQWALAGLPMRW